MKITNAGASLNVAQVWTQSQETRRDNIGTVSTDARILSNTTPAASGLQQISPRQRYVAQGWKTNATAASQQIDWIEQLVSLQGAANPGGYKEYLFQTNGLGYVRAGLISYVPTSGTVDGWGNVFWGYNAGVSNFTTGGANQAYNNTFIGAESGNKNDQGYQNTAVGSRSFHENVTGYECTFVGQGAGYSNLLEHQVGVGFHALLNNTGNNNVAIGAQAGESTAGASTSANNIFIGYQVGKNNLSSSTGNTLIGHLSGVVLSSGIYNATLGYLAGTALTTGGGNVFVGRETGKLISTQSDCVFVGKLAGSAAIAASNTFVGSAAGLSSTSGANNVFLGFQAGYTATAANANTTGANNTFVGYNSGPGTSSQLSNASAFGNGALVSASNAIQLGNTSVTLVATSGVIQLGSYADASAPNSSLYYSTTQSKLVWKDSGGVINNLY